MTMSVHSWCSECVHTENSSTTGHNPKSFTHNRQTPKGISSLYSCIVKLSAAHQHDMRLDTCTCAKYLFSVDARGDCCNARTPDILRPMVANQRVVLAHYQTRIQWALSIGLFSEIDHPYPNPPPNAHGPSSISIFHIQLIDPISLGFIGCGQFHIAVGVGVCNGFKFQVPDTSHGNGNFIHFPHFSLSTAWCPPSYNGGERTQRNVSRQRGWNPSWGSLMGPVAYETVRKRETTHRSKTSIFANKNKAEDVH